MMFTHNDGLGYSSLTLTDGANPLSGGGWNEPKIIVSLVLNSELHNSTHRSRDTVRCIAPLY